MTSVTESTWTVPTAAELRTELAAIDLPALVARHGTPLLVLDPARLAGQYRALRRVLPDVRPYYAVKALSHRDALAAVRDEDGFFDVASRREVALVADLGVPPDRCIYTHPVKKRADVAAAVRTGIRTFVFDNVRELTSSPVSRTGSNSCSGSSTARRRRSSTFPTSTAPRPTKPWISCGPRSGGGCGSAACRSTLAAS